MRGFIWNVFQMWSIFADDLEFKELNYYQLHQFASH